MNNKSQISFPRMVISVPLVGHNSLVGSLAEELIDKGLIKDVGILNPEEIVFVVKKILSEVDIYEELNKVRDLFKIDEKKITMLMGMA